MIQWTENSHPKLHVQVFAFVTLPITIAYGHGRCPQVTPDVQMQPILRVDEGVIPDWILSAALKIQDDL